MTNISSGTIPENNLQYSNADFKKLSKNSISGQFILQKWAEMKTFLDKQKIKEFEQNALKEILKKVLQAERKHWKDDNSNSQEEMRTKKCIY